MTSAKGRHGQLQQRTWPTGCRPGHCASDPASAQGTRLAELRGRAARGGARALINRRRRIAGTRLLLTMMSRDGPTAHGSRCGLRSQVASAGGLTGRRRFRLAGAASSRGSSGAVRTRRTVVSVRRSPHAPGPCRHARWQWSESLAIAATVTAPPFGKASRRAGELQRLQQRPSSHFLRWQSSQRFHRALPGKAPGATSTPSKPRVTARQIMSSGPPSPDADRTVSTPTSRPRTPTTWPSAPQSALRADAIYNKGALVAPWRNQPRSESS